MFPSAFLECAQHLLRNKRKQILSLILKKPQWGRSPSWSWGCPPRRRHTYRTLAQTLHLHLRELAVKARHSLQTRCWHSSQSSPRSKIRPKVLRQRAHSLSPDSWGRGKPLCLISKSSFFIFLKGRNRRRPKRQRRWRVHDKKRWWNGDDVLTGSFSPLVFLVSHLFEELLGSFLFHDPAEMRGSGPPQLSPLAPLGKLSQINLPI